MQFQKESSRNKVVIKSYNPGKINISGFEYDSPVLLDSESIHLLSETHEKSVSSFKQFIQEGSDRLFKLLSHNVEVLIIGTGNTHLFLPPNITQEIHAKGIAVEVMTTRHACHTFQVLVHDQRKVQAILFP